MRWTLNFKNEKTKRVVVKFDPLNDLVIFTGQCRMHNAGWIDFSENKIESKEVDFKKIQEIVAISHEAITNRFAMFNNLNDGLSAIDSVDMTNDE